MTARQSGIYRIRCLPSGKVYVGSSVNIDNRWERHLYLLRRGEHHSPHLQYAWNKHGEDAFVFEIVELVEKAQLLIREQEWINESQCCDDAFGYNVAPIADGGTRPGSGRPRLALDLRQPNRRGKIAVEISPAAALALQARLLRDEGAATPEALVELLIYRGVLQPA